MCNAQLTSLRQTSYSPQNTPLQTMLNRAGVHRQETRFKQNEAPGPRYVSWNYPTLQDIHVHMNRKAQRVGRSTDEITSCSKQPRLLYDEEQILGDIAEANLRGSNCLRWSLCCGRRVSRVFRLHDCCFGRNHMLTFEQRLLFQDCVQPTSWCVAEVEHWANA